MSTVITIPATAIVANVEKHTAAQTLAADITNLAFQLTDTNNLWIKAITGVTNLTNPTVTTLNVHNLAIGAAIIIKGVAGAIGVNGSFVVASTPTTKKFTVTAAAPGVYTSGGTVADQTKNITIWGAQRSRQATGGGIIVTVTNLANPVITTQGPHGLGIGSDIRIEGVVGAVGINGAWLVASVIDANNFTIAVSAPGVYVSGGTIWTLEDAAGGIAFGSLQKNGSMPAQIMTPGNLPGAVGDSLRLAITTDADITLGAVVTIN